MHTLDTHLVGVSATAPHPQGYRPDLPLLLAGDPDGDGRYDEGHSDGFDEGEEAGYHRGYTAGEKAAVAKVRRQMEIPGA